MNDLTFEEITAAIPDGDPIKAWWTSASSLPSDTTTNEFFIKTLKACGDAQRAKNLNLQAGSRIDAYPSPTNGPVTVDTNTGLQSFITTYSVRSRVAVNLDISISPLA